MKEIMIQYVVSRIPAIQGVFFAGCVFSFGAMVIFAEKLYQENKIFFKKYLIASFLMFSIFVSLLVAIPNQQDAAQLWHNYKTNVTILENLYER